LFLVLVFLVAIAVVPVSLHAQGLVACGGASQDPCQLCDIFQLISNILNFFVWPLGPTIATLMLATGGFMFFAGGANPVWITRARSIMTAAVIGIVIIFVAWLAVHFVLDFFGVASWTGLGTWWEITC